MHTSAPRASYPRPLVLGWVLALMAALALTFAPAASAHDVLIDSRPGDESSGPAPEEIVLTFSANIAEIGALIEVEGPDGVVSVGDVVVEGPVAIQELEPDLSAGDYQITWRVTSSDGHPISGELTFTVEAAEETVEPTTEPEPTTDPAPTGEDTTAPAETTDPAPTGEDTTEPAETTAPAETTEPADTATTEADQTETTAPVTSDPTEETASEESGGLPVWTWVVLGVAVLGLAALLLGWSRRARAEDGDAPTGSDPS